MKNNRMLKIYLITAIAAVLLFIAGFVFGINNFNNMDDMYGATLPFLLIAAAAITAFGFSPAEIKTKKQCVRAVNTAVRTSSNVVPLKRAYNERLGYYQGQGQVQVRARVRAQTLEKIS